jgi:hypothetical protein
MDYFNLVVHKTHLELEITHLKTQLEEYDTGHIITAISVLEHRVNEIKKELQEKV